MKLSEFEQRRLTLTMGAQIIHPQLKQYVGRMATDDKGRRAAVFKRDPDEHYFRKYTGYAVSVAVLQDIFSRGARVVYIAEDADEKTDRRIIEYDITEFTSGTLIAYNPNENTIVEGDRAVAAADDRAFSDHQRVVDDENVTRVWEYGDFDMIP